MELVAINGKITRPEEAVISVYDRGFLYGDGVYEVTRSYGRVLFALEDHIDRLFNSASRIHLDLGLSKSELIQELYRIYGASEQDDMYMRVIVTRGQGRINLDPNSVTKPNFVVFVQNIPTIDPTFYSAGQDLITSSILRNAKKALDPNVKSGNYLNNIMALGEAKKKKAYDAIMVNKDGMVTEGTTWNVFMVKDQTYITAPDDADILQGITRKILRQVAHENKLKWTERYFSPEELKAADEAFTTSSLKEVMPIRSVDGQLIAGGKPGVLTAKLAGLYKDYVKGYCKSHKSQSGEA